MRGLIKALGVAVYTTDAAGRLTFYNEAAVALWGCRPPLGDARWCGSWRIHRPDGAPMPHEECPMAVALREGRPIRGEEALAERPDGVRVPFAAYPTPLRDDAGQLVGGVNVLVDISKRKAAEVALAESEARLHLALEASAGSPSGSSIRRQARCCVRPSTTRSSAMKLLCRHGATRRSWATCCRRTAGRWRAPTGRRSRAAAPARSSNAASAAPATARCAGSRCTGGPSATRKGAVVRLHGVLRDVTARKRAEEARRRFAALADASGEFIGMRDTRLVPFYVNAAGLRLVGLDNLEQAQQTPVLDSSSPKTGRPSARSSYRGCCVTAAARSRPGSATSRPARRCG